ncbi:unnamed protein product [Gadus morhua 'NCC']
MRSLVASPMRDRPFGTLAQTPSAIAPCARPRYPRTTNSLHNVPAPPPARAAPLARERKLGDTRSPPDPAHVPLSPGDLQHLFTVSPSRSAPPSLSPMRLQPAAVATVGPNWRTNTRAPPLTQPGTQNSDTEFIRSSGIWPNHLARAQHGTQPTAGACPGPCQPTPALLQQAIIEVWPGAFMVAILSSSTPPHPGPPSPSLIPGAPACARLGAVGAYCIIPPAPTHRRNISEVLRAPGPPPSSAFHPPPLRTLCRLLRRQERRTGGEAPVDPRLHAATTRTLRTPRKTNPPPKAALRCPQSGQAPSRTHRRDAPVASPSRPHAHSTRAPSAPTPPAQNPRSMAPLPSHTIPYTPPPPAARP